MTEKYIFEEIEEQSKEITEDEAEDICNKKGLVWGGETSVKDIELSELKKLLTRYDRIKTDWQQSKLYATGKTSEISSDALLEYSFASLKSVAGFPSTIRSFFSSILLSNILDTLVPFKFKANESKFYSIGVYLRFLTYSILLSN